MVLTFRHCLSALDSEMGKQFFLYVLPEDAELYKNPLDVFAKVVAAFPSTSGNVIEACRSYALGRYMACVFHCVGILQYGLFALADEVKVELPTPLRMADWCTLITRIEGRIKEFKNPPTSQPKSEAREATLAFYSECSLHFRHFKDAWRNPVAHLRLEFDQREADGILSHTREFMEHLSGRVKEREIPKLHIDGME